MKRVYISGSGGMLGEAFYDVFSRRHDVRCSDIDLNASWLVECDVRDLHAYRRDVLAFRPDCLIHLAALTDLEYCETHVEESYATNTIGAENASLIANELNVPVVYISTAGIFDGQQEVYDDWDTPNPLGHYARSKYMGEVYIVNNCSRYLVCRAGWMMGGGPAKDKKFVNKIIKQIERGSTQLDVVNDRMGTPTYTIDFARNVRELLTTGAWGVYNMVCGGLTDRVSVAREILRHFDLEGSVSIREVGSAHFADTYFAPRPPCERLINRRLDLRGMNLMRDWRVALNDYLAARFTNLDYGRNR